MRAAPDITKAASPVRRAASHTDYTRDNQHIAVVSRASRERIGIGTVTKRLPAVSLAKRAKRGLPADAPEDKDRVNEKSRALSRLWIYLLATAVVGAVVIWRARGASRAEVTVGRTVTVKRGEIGVRVSENGTLDPVTQVDVKSKVAGRVLKIYVKEGDHVVAGQTLAVVDPTEVSRQVASIEAQLSAARAGLQQAEDNYHLTKTQDGLAIQRSEASLAEAKKRLVQAAAPTRHQDVGAQEAAVARADAQVADAERNLARKQALVAKGFIAQSEADTAQTNLTVARADAASARQQLSLLKEGPRTVDIDVARAAVQTSQVQLATDRANTAQEQLRLQDVARAHAEVVQYENQLAQQSVQLHDTRIVAPIGGEVTGKFLEEGELVASATAGFAQGATIVRIADLSRMQVKVNINEVDVARLKEGLPVEIHVDSIPDKTFHGVIAAVSPSSTTENQQSVSSSATSQAGVVRFEVKIAVKDADARLRPGMTAAVDIIEARHRGARILPAEAIQPGNKVTVVTGSGRTLAKTTRTISLGLKNDATVEVLSGLDVGDKVEVPTITAPDRRKINVNGPD